MFIKKLDYLSPNVTFYYKGYLSHTSIISGIISITSILIIIIQVIYYSLHIIERKDVNAFYFNSFLEDVGTFPFNASSLFHFISLGELGENYWSVAVNFTKYRIIGFDTYYNYYLKDRNLSNYNHWLYGFCNNKTDTEGIGYLINHKFFETSACIRKYFDSQEQKYYDTDHPKFRWPIMARGSFNDDNIFYNIIIESCKEDTLNLILGNGYQCKKDPLIELNTVYFYFVNNYINLLNYKNPITKFIYRIETGISKNEYYINNLNFIPSIIETHNGLLLDHIEEEKTYIFERNDANKQIKFDQEDIYISYYFWIKNTMNYYQRNYKRIQDVISNIGGINQVVIILSIYINSLYNQYIVLHDTESLLFSSIHSEKKEMKKANKDYKVSDKIKISEKEKTNKISTNNNDDKNKSSVKGRNKQIEKSINNFSKSNHMFLNNSEDIDHNYEFQTQIIENNKIAEKSKSHHTTKNRIKHFCDFILFKLCCAKKYKWFKVYQNFRIKIISEEHLIKNHLNIYNLLRATHNKRKFRRNSYQLKDLIKLI